MHTNSRWIKDTNNNTIVLKGVSKPGLEYLGLALDTIIPEMIEYDIQLMNKWHINTVRIPLRDIHWLTNNEYRIKTDNFITSYLAAGYYIILDLHTLGYNPKQDKFLLKSPNNDGLKFWIEISKTYKNDKIFYELFNEPYGISPLTWWYGDETFYGYKTIINEIRKNSDNICILGGLDYSYQWKFLSYNSNIMTEMSVISNLALSFHPYGYKGGPTTDGLNTEQIPYKINYPNNDYIGDCSIGYTIPTIPKSEYGWYESFGYLSNKFPMIATEFGLDKDDTCIQGGWYSNDILEYFNNNSMSYIAWAWTPNRLSYPSLLDKNLNPTGMAASFPYGPPCGVKQNNYYKGPGKLVFDNLTNNTLGRKLKCNINKTGQKSYIFNLKSNYNQYYKLLYIVCLLLLTITIIVVFIITYYLINKLMSVCNTMPKKIYINEENKRDYCKKLRCRSVASKLNICILE